MAWQGSLSNRTVQIKSLKTMESKDVPKNFPLVSWLTSFATLCHAGTVQVNTNAGVRLCLKVLP